MFQTSMNAALQAHGSPFLTFVLRAVTVTGYEQFFVALVLIVMFGINFRKGAILFQLIIWTAVATELCKEIANLPRPFWVSPEVQDLEVGTASGPGFDVMKGQGFLQTLPPEVVAAFRAQGGSPGFPSGHVASAAACWGGLGLLFDNRALRWATPFIVAVMAFSRMYLGRHFLADVLGGALVGSAALIIAYTVFRRLNFDKKMFDPENLIHAWRLPNLLFYSLQFLMPVILVLVTLLPPQLGGYMVGANFALLLSSLRGLPEGGDGALRRTARVCLAGLCFVLVALALSMSTQALGPAGGGPTASFLGGLLCSFAAIWGGLTLSRELGLYGKTA